MKAAEKAAVKHLDIFLFFRIMSGNIACRHVKYY